MSDLIYFVHDYGEAKNKFEDLLSVNDMPIILLGEGGNGKTFLVNEMKRLGHMHSGWSFNPEYYPEMCLDNNGKSLAQPLLNNVYEIRNATQLSYIEKPCYVIDMSALKY
jgi:hypothetical protein